MEARDPGSQLALLLAAEHSRLYRMAYSWCCDATLAADLSQEAMLKALGRLEQLSDPKKLKPWLYTILCNCFRRYLRDRRPNESLEEIVLEHEEGFECVESTESSSARNETIRQVHEAMCKLPFGQRQVITLVVLNDSSYAEVAEILNVPIGTVMSRLHRARSALRTLLEGQASAAELRPGLRLVGQEPN